MTSGHELHQALSEFARDMLDAATTPQTVDVMTQTVLKEIHGADAVGVSLLHRNKRIQTLGATAPFVEEADQLQYDLTEGPCMDAIFDEHIVHSADLTDEKRWQTWAPIVVERWSVRSMLCLRLFIHDRHVGALNIYSHKDHGFDAESLEDARYYAAQAAVAVAAMQEIETLRVAVESRTVIGQAQGILMERFGFGARDAFSVLARTSQHLNRKLASIAEDLVETRRLPEDS